MYINNKLTKAIRLATTLGAVSALTLSYSAIAEQNEAEANSVERIAVTGSSIKRTDFEGALPVQVISREQIDASGINNAGEFIQSLPAMQGFTVAAQSVGGGGGGIKTASLRGLGAEYTLVLLNGRRLAPRGSGSQIDLNSIPLAAIERVEVLTDGASALYGSDAIGGVVNFITKDNMEDIIVSARYTRPQKKGGDDYNLSITGGFGDYISDGYNVLFSVSRDDQNQIKGVDRDFAKTGIIPFTRNDQEYWFVAGSTNGIPGNVQLRFPTESGLSDRLFSPYLERNGACPTDTFQEGTECSWDFTTTLEIYPENKRDALMLNADFRINDDTKLFVQSNFSEYSETNRIAPYPTGFFPLPLDSQLVQDWVMPHLSAEEQAALTGVNARWRALPVGARATNITTNSTHVVLGLEGIIGDDFDYSLAAFHSVNEAKESFVGGWLLLDEFNTLMRSGQVNIFDTPDNLTSQEKQLLDGTVYNGHWTTAKSVMKGADFKGSLPVFELPDGTVYLGFGTEFRNTHYTNSISDVNREEKILFLSRGTDYDLKRNNFGAFAEIIIPAFENFELSAALRYDAIGKISNAITYDASGFPTEGTGSKVGESMNRSTYKVSGRYQLNDDWLLRASYGTGFKAPSMLGIAQPRVPAGVTGGGYACPFQSSDPKAAWCFSGPSQYAVFNQGYENLKPELSTQTSAGFVYAPNLDFNVTLDFWRVDITDRVTSLTEQQIFSNPQRYYDLFVPNRNLSTGDIELAIVRSSVNIGESKNAGLDWEVVVSNDLSFGRLRTSLSGTYMLESKRTVPGTEDEWTSSLGRFGTDQNVVFRTIAHLTNTLTHGDFAHNAVLRYRSGYDDRFVPAADNAVRQGPHSEGVPSGPGVPMQLTVPSYITVNYNARYTGFDNFVLSAGINNMFDKQPPLSLRGGQGHQTGYDHRYTDAFGRTFFVGVDYTF